MPLPLDLMLNVRSAFAMSLGPDGSIFVTDWYDPGVGGHQQKDLDRGRSSVALSPEEQEAVDRAMAR